MINKHYKNVFDLASKMRRRLAVECYLSQLK